MFSDFFCIIIFTAFSALLVFNIMNFIRNRDKTKLKYTDAKFGKIVIKLMLDDNVNENEINGIINSHKNDIIGYFLKSIYYFNNKQFEKSYSIVIALLVKEKIDSDIRKYLNYFAAKNLFELKRYKESYEFIKNTEKGLFFSTPSLFSSFKGKIEIYLGNANGFAKLEKRIKKEDYNEDVIKAYKYNKKLDIIERAIHYGIYNEELFNIFTRELIRKHDDNAIINFLKINLKNLFNHNLNELYVYFRKSDNIEDIYKKIKKSRMENYDKEILKLFFSTMLDDDVEFKLILKEIKNDYINLGEKNKSLINRILVITGKEKYSYFLGES